MEPTPGHRVPPSVALAIEHLHAALRVEYPGDWAYFVRVGGELVAHGSPGQRLRPSVRKEVPR